MYFCLQYSESIRKALQTTISNLFVLHPQSNPLIPRGPLHQNLLCDTLLSSDQSKLIFSNQLLLLQLPSVNEEPTLSYKRVQLVDPFIYKIIYKYILISLYFKRFFLIFYSLSHHSSSSSTPLTSPFFHSTPLPHLTLLLLLLPPSPFFFSLTLLLLPLPQPSPSPLPKQELLYY